MVRDRTPLRGILLVLRRDSTLQNLKELNGLTDAAGGVEKTLAEQDKPIRNALKVVYTTLDMSSHRCGD